MNKYYWEKFYEDNVRPEIEKRGEVYIEWTITKSHLVKQLNFLRAKYQFTVTYFKKDERPDVFCVFIKPNLSSSEFKHNKI